MADNENLDYEKMIDEIATFNHTDNEHTAKRILEMQQELSGVALADRNDDHRFAWMELHEKANSLIAELADKPMDGISKDQLEAYQSLLANFSSHVGEEYSDIAQTLKSKLDTRQADIEKEAVQEDITPPVDKENDNYEKPQTEDTKDDEDIKDTILDEDKQKFLDSITDENKQQIAERYNKIETAASELNDLFAEPETEKSDDEFAGLRNFYNNVWVDCNVPNDENAQPKKINLKKRQQLKEHIQEMATIMTIQDLVANKTVDDMSEEQLKKKVREAVRDNMEFLTFHLVSTQGSFKVLENAKDEDKKDITKLTPKERSEYMSSLLSEKNDFAQVFQNVSDTLSGGKANGISIGSPAINATILPHFKQAKKFAKDFAKKTGITKMLNRIKAFDDKMTKDHPILWGLAKSSAVSALTGPTGVMVYTGYSVYGLIKETRKEYLKQKEANENMTLGKFLGKNKGKLASIVLSTGFALYGGFDTLKGIASLDVGAVLKNTGLLGNMAGSLLSGDALNNVSQNLSWDNICKGAHNMVDKIANVSHVDVSQVWSGIKDSYTGTRITRVALSGLGVGVAKAHDAYLKAVDGNKWKAARQAFLSHLSGTLVGFAAADAMTATNTVVTDMMHQDAIELQEVKNLQENFENGLKSIEQIQDSVHIPNDYAQHFEDDSISPKVSEFTHTATNINSNDTSPEQLAEIPTEARVVDPTSYSNLNIGNQPIADTVNSDVSQEQTSTNVLQDNSDTSMTPEQLAEIPTEARVVDPTSYSNPNIERQPIADTVNSDVSQEQTGTNVLQDNSDTSMTPEQLAEIPTEARVVNPTSYSNPNIERQPIADTVNGDISQEQNGTNVLQDNSDTSMTPEQLAEIPTEARVVNPTSYSNPNIERQPIADTVNGDISQEQNGTNVLQDNSDTSMTPEQLAEIPTEARVVNPTSYSNPNIERQPIPAIDPSTIVSEPAPEQIEAPEFTTEPVKDDETKPMTEPEKTKETKLTPEPGKTDDPYEKAKIDAQKSYSDKIKEADNNYNQSVQEANNDYDKFVGEIKGEYEQNMVNINQDWDELKQHQAQEWNNHIKEAVINQQMMDKNEYPDYSNQTKELGLKDTEVLHHSYGTRTYTSDHGTLQYPTVNEFCQANNGFALVDGDRIRSVTIVDGKPQFQITENGTTKLMTKAQAEQFMKSVYNTGHNVEGFNAKQADAIKALQNRGDVEYGRGGSLRDSYNSRNMENNNTNDTGNRSNTRTSLREQLGGNNNSGSRSSSIGSMRGGLRDRINSVKQNSI